MISKSAHWFALYFALFLVEAFSQIASSIRETGKSLLRQWQGGEVHSSSLKTAGNQLLFVVGSN